MLIDHDSGEGVAYIYLTDPSATPPLGRTETFEATRDYVCLDFDEAGNVIGIQVFG